MGKKYVAKTFKRMREQINLNNILKIFAGSEKNTGEANKLTSI